MKKHLNIYTARIEIIDGRYFARQVNGQLWCLPPEKVSFLPHGANIAISIPDPQDQFCSFVGVRPD